jgi:Carboxypeptidase regulatory-like domain/TonB dependent receptor-like, beta-barrel/TonB-dependent Receptor Plug Domain
MLKKLAVLVSVMCIAVVAFAQGQGTIKGKMIDKATGEPLAFANIVVMKGGAQVAGAQTDFDGKYTITALNAGSYDLQATYVGYQPIKITNVIVMVGKITFQDVKAGQGVDLKTFEVVDYEVPLISKDQTSSGGTVTREAIAKMPGRSAASIAATVGGVYSQDDGGTDLNIRGSRSSGTDVYIDGVKVRGSQNLPSSAIEQVSVITGGIPAQYGDATGGIVNITTRGASKDWFGGIEYLTSGFKKGDDDIIGLDDHGFNLLGFSLSGPLKTKKDSAGNKKNAILGFFLSGELKHEVDPRPNALTNFKVNDDLMDGLNANPYSLGENQTGVINNASFVRASDLEETPFRLNSSRKGLNIAGKVDITTSSTTNVTIGGSFDYTDANLWDRRNALFNSQNNGQDINRTWRVYGRFTQRFDNNTDEESSSLVQNAFVSFQVDYSNTIRKTQSREHKDQFSRYGYLGKFTSTRQDIFENVIDTVFEVDAQGNLTGNQYAGFLSNQATVAYDYEASDINPILSNYTSDYYNIYANSPIGFLSTPVEVEGNGGILNGNSPSSIYTGLYNPMGVPYNAYSYRNRDQFRVTASGSADLKGHAIKIGFEYEQRDDRNYSINPRGLWTLGRQLVNNQIAQRSFEAGTFTIFPGAGGNSVDNILLSYAYDATPGVHSQFDKNLRQTLGMAENGTNWIDFDSYGPDVWTIDMFTPDEIHTGARGILSNFGYDHTGKKLSDNPSVDDFFNDTDANGNKIRANPSFQPIYVAGYIQDKFAFDDLIFNIGVRIDRYDANQAVLKDEYTLFPANTVGEVGGSHPSNIGNDFVVYVKDAKDPKIGDVVGYRDGDVWYNASGAEIDDPTILHSSGIPNPWLVDPNDEDVFFDLDGESFKDFEPQVNVSPRISFSFPISDEALFFAHYDILTQRPSVGNRLDLISYLNFNGGTNYLPGQNPYNNPALKAEKTIDYELGFQQKLSNSSALKLSAFYREMRDQIQTRQIIGGFPGNYITYGNVDFGTVKGMTINYDLRRSGNLTLRASYTLQFADGTGSSSTTSQNLVSSGNGSLRTLIPLAFDQRHSIILSMDYRYRSGKNYNGPVVFGKDIFQNTGANLTMRNGSGTPYTKTSRIVTTQQTGAPNSPQEGQLNAARLPWSTTLDLKVDRTIDLKWGKGEDEDKKEASLNVYIQVLNLMDADNVLGVYSATGNADDDGYLAAAEWQNLIALAIDETALRDLYTAKLASNPFNYSLPRRIRLGIQLNF